MKAASKDSDRLPSNCDSCHWRAVVKFVSGLFIFSCIKLNRVENLFKYVHHGPFIYIINNKINNIKSHFGKIYISQL